MTTDDKKNLIYTCPECGLDITYPPGADLFQLAIDHLPRCQSTKTAPKIKRLSEVVPEEALKGNLVSIDDILDREVLVTAITWRESTFKEDQDYLSLTVEIDGEEKVLNTSATRVLQAFRALDLNNLPVYALFKRIQLPNGRRVYTVQ